MNGPTLGSLTKSEGRYLKLSDLEKITNTKWWEINLPATIIGATMDHYPDGKEAYLIHFQGIEKPYGTNVTARRVLVRALGEDVGWGDPSFNGIAVTLYGEDSEKGPGIRLRLGHPQQAAPMAGATQAHIPDAGATPSDRPPTNVNEPAHVNEQVPPPSDQDDIPF